MPGHSLHGCCLHGFCSRLAAQIHWPGRLWEDAASEHAPVSSPNAHLSQGLQTLCVVQEYGRQLLQQAGVPQDADAPLLERLCLTRQLTQAGDKLKNKCVPVTCKTAACSTVMTPKVSCSSCQAPQPARVCVLL